MKKSNLFLQTAVAAALGLIGSQAFASNFTNVPVSTFAVEGVPSTGAVTINGGAVYTATTSPALDSGLVTVTLPAGVTFVNTPSVAPDATVFTAATVTGGGAGANSIVISVTKGAAGVGTVTLGSFQVTGATKLLSKTVTGDLQMTAQASGWAVATPVNDASALKVDLALSDSQLIVTPTSATATIDVAGANGTKFVAAGNTIAGAASLGNLVVNNGTFRNASNTAAFAFTGTTASATVSGDFAGVTKAYLAAGAGACATTIPVGAITGTVTATSLTFAGITPGAATREVCAIIDTTTLLHANSAFTVAATQDTTTNSKAFGTASWSYNGTVVSMDYVVGTSAGYTNYIRVVNPTSAAAKVLVSVQSDAGVVKSGTLDAALAANSAKLYTVADVNTATGANLTSATDRAALNVLSASAIRASNLLFNPNGTLVNVQ